MVDLIGTCIVRAADLGTLSTIEIRLSPTAPQEVIKQLRDLVVDPEEEGRNVEGTVAINTGISMLASASTFSLADVQLRLVPEDERQISKEFSWLQRRVGIETIYHVVAIVVGVVQLLNLLQPYIQDIRELDTDLIVPFEQLVERIIKTLKEEQPQPTPKPTSDSKGD